MLKIRLTRVGKKNSPAYRVVIADKKRAVKGKFIEIIGNYNPILKPKQIVINKDRALFWMNLGAQPSDTVNNLMCDLEILPKNKKIKKTFGKKLSKKAIKEEAEKKPEVVAAPAQEEKTEEETKPEEPAEEIKPEISDEKPAETPLEDSEEESKSKEPAEEIKDENINEK